MFTILHPHFSYLSESLPDSLVARFETFSDGWPRVFLGQKNHICNNTLAYIGDFRYVNDFFGQIAFLDGLMRYGPEFLHIYVPFFPAASMERDTPS